MLPEHSTYGRDIIGPVMAARLLSLDRSTVRRLANRGAIPVYAWTPGGHARFRRADVEALRERLAARSKRGRTVKRLRQRAGAKSREVRDDGQRA